MKLYGANRTTEFTKKQINVVFSKAKKGELKIEKWYMHRLYDLADYYGYDSNRSVEYEEGFILKILENVFNNENEKAQELINNQTECVFNNLSNKNKEKADRNFI